MSITTDTIISKTQKQSYVRSHNVMYHTDIQVDGSSSEYQLYVSQV
jgi:hypothetical protein